MELTKDSISLYNQARKENHLKEEFIRDCEVISETISTMMGEPKVGICAMAETLQYCCSNGRGLADLSAAYNKYAQSTLEELRTSDTKFHNEWCNHPGSTQERQIELGFSPFAAKRMAEVYAAIYDLPVLKV